MVPEMNAGLIHGTRLLPRARLPFDEEYLQSLAMQQERRVDAEYASPDDQEIYAYPVVHIYSIAWIVKSGKLAADSIDVS